MALQLKDYRLPPVLEVIKGNIVKYGNPLALNGTEISQWAKGLELPPEGDVLLFTGGEYQLVPYIDSLVQAMTRVEQGSTAFSLLMGARNLFDRVGINAEKIFASVTARDWARFNQIPFKAASILRELGLEVCYLGEREVYSGALLYEFGYWKELQALARQVTSLLRQTCARTVICLSPHAAAVFKLVYPQLVDGFDLQIKTFVEAVWDLARGNGGIRVDYAGTVTIHDPCRLSRDLGLAGEIRDMLEGAGGVKVVEPERNRRWTSCCGGPAKVLFPEIATALGGRRVDELATTGADLALTFCPYCTAALQAGVEKNGTPMVVEDFIEFLYRGVAR